MAKHAIRGLLRNIATDGSVADLEPFVDRLSDAAKAYGEATGAFEMQEARRLLVDAAYYLIWNTREYIGRRERAKRKRATMSNPNSPSDVTSRPFPKYGEPGYEHPELILDPETGLYDVLWHGCTTHARLDVVGQREKIRMAAALPAEAGPTGSKAE